MRHNLTWHRLLAFSLLVFLAVPLSAQRNESQDLSFSWKNEPLPQAVPPAVLRLLLTRKDVKQAFADSDPSLRKNPAQVFSATETHTHNADAIDLIVEGIFVDSAADASPFTPEAKSRFWVIRFAHTAPQVVFATGDRFTDFALNFSKNAKSSPTITLDSPAAGMDDYIEETYRFRETKYYLVKRKIIHESDED